MDINSNFNDKHMIYSYIVKKPGSEGGSKADKPDVHAIYSYIIKGDDEDIFPIKKEKPDVHAIYSYIIERGEDESDPADFFKDFKGIQEPSFLDKLMEFFEQLLSKYSENKENK